MEKELDWGNLSFGYIPTDYNVRCYYRDGKWGEIEVSSSETVTMHIAATSLHYGQEIFEGLKAFRGKDGKVRVFRLEENAKRIIESAKGIMMAPVPVELFTEMVKNVPVDMIPAAIAAVRIDFADFWSQTLVNVMRPLNHLRYNDTDDGHDL